MDEPCSALDPIATAKVEELISELSTQYTIAIVTHSMQQAARVSDRTAYFHLGDLIEVNSTEKVFTQPDHQLTEAYITGRFGWYAQLEIFEKTEPKCSVFLCACIWFGDEIAMMMDIVY